MTNSTHPWTMYEVARYRDEERELRAQAYRQAMRAKRESEARSESSSATAGWLEHVLHGHFLAWVHGHHLRPVRHG
jgi:hypothetical protein